MMQSALTDLLSVRCVVEKSVRVGDFMLRGGIDVFESIDVVGREMVGGGLMFDALGGCGVVMTS